MSRGRARGVVSAVVLGVLVVHALSGAADAATVVATERAVTAVRVHGDRAVWSSYNRRTKSYALMTRLAGRTERVPVRGRSVPFDADLGPGPSGSTVVVYSRCAREPISDPGRSLPAEHRTGRACDVYSYDFSGRRERKVRSADTSRYSEFLPTIWRKRIAFARVDWRRRGRAGVLPHLVVGGLKDRSRLRRLRGGRHGFYTPLVVVAGKLEWDGGPGPMALDLRGVSLAYSWGRYERKGCERPPGPSEIDEVLTQVFVEETGRRRQLVDAGCDFDPTGFVGDSAWYGSRLVYRRYDGRTNGNASQWLRRVDLTRGTVDQVELPAQVFSAALGLGGLVYAQQRNPDDEDPRSRTVVVEDEAVNFRPFP